MCLTPITIKHKERDPVDVPCGRCPKCIGRKISGWSFRLLCEEKISNSSFFLTLTYDTENVPITAKGFMGLRVRDLQLFFKRIRSAFDYRERTNKDGCRGNGRVKYSLKYFGVGEYGTRSNRPHYHAILYNVPLELIIGEEDARAVSLGLLSLNGKVPFKCPHWQNGYVTVGSVSGASIGYCLKYMSKESRIPMHGNDDRKKEFRLMSKGLGLNYLSEAMIKWHKTDPANRMYCPLEDGRKISMPRYYKDRIFDSSDRRLAKDAMLKKMEDRAMLAAGGAIKIPTAREHKENVNAAFKRMYKTAIHNRKTV